MLMIRWMEKKEKDERNGGAKMLDKIYFRGKIWYDVVMKKIVSLFMAIFMCGVMATAVIPAGEVLAKKGKPATDSCSKTMFLGLRPWYAGLAENVNGSCVVKWPAKDGGTASGDDLASFVWKIVLNISADIALLVGYVAIGFVIYGGFKYIMSTGEPGKVAEAKKMITNALIGLVIAVLATVIVNTILVVIGAAAS